MLTTALAVGSSTALLMVGVTGCAHADPVAAPLPIDGLLEPLLAACTPGATVLLQAPPGACKTTRVPLALLAGLNSNSGGAGTKAGRIWMLEPRRLAAKAAAQRLAAELDEPLGQQV